METLKIHKESLLSSLSELLTLMQTGNNTGQLHLGHAQAVQAPDGKRSPLGLRVLGINEHFLPGILKAMGIRGVTFDHLADPRPILSLNKIFEDSDGITIADLINKQESLELLRLFFYNCKTIAFDDWVENPINASIWQLLLAKIIAPIGKDQLDFIFYLGDPEKRGSLEIHEVMGVMLAFSEYGQVTLALNESEAIHLWDILNSRPIKKVETLSQPLLQENKFASLFNALGIANLLIYSTKHAMLVSNSLQIEVSRKLVNSSTEISLDARDHFIAGFASGLLMKFDLISCLTLGLTVFGSNGDIIKEDESVRLSNYLREWIAEL
jgi:hypothetical protein